MTFELLFTAFIGVIILLHLAARLHRMASRWFPTQPSVATPQGEDTEARLAEKNDWYCYFKPSVLTGGR